MEVDIFKIQWCTLLFSAVINPRVDSTLLFGANE